MEKYILFDLDGTVTDPETGITLSVAYAIYERCSTVRGSYDPCALGSAFAHLDLLAVDGIRNKAYITRGKLTGDLAVNDIELVINNVGIKGRIGEVRP